MGNPEPATETLAAQAESGEATAAVPTTLTVTEPARDFDYFADHDVNPATKIEATPDLLGPDAPHRPGPPRDNEVSPQAGRR